MDRSRVGIVRQLGERGLIGRKVQHPVEFGLLPPFRGGLQQYSPLLQAAGQKDRLLHGLLMVRVGFGTELREE
jgi:hypothetical protein